MLGEGKQTTVVLLALSFSEPMPLDCELHICLSVLPTP